MKSTGEHGQKYLRAAASIPPVVDGDFTLHLEGDEPTVSMSLQAFTRIGEAFTAQIGSTFMGVDGHAEVRILEEGGDHGEPVREGGVGIQFQSRAGNFTVMGETIVVRRLIVQAVEMLSAAEPSVGADVAVNEPT